MQSRAVTGAMKTWLPCVCTGYSQIARATIGRNLRGRTPSPPKSEAECMEKEVGEEEIGSRPPPKGVRTMEDLVGGVEETPLTPTPILHSPTLKHTGASPPIKPSLQQKRKVHAMDRRVLDKVNCARLDGTPLEGATESNQEHGENEDGCGSDPLLYQKPSPLSEIEYEDTRFPITQTIDDEVTKDPIEEVVGFSEEQLDTAEEAMLRAKWLFDEAASRGGDPDFPPSRVLTSLLKSRRG